MLLSSTSKEGRRERKHVKAEDFFYINFSSSLRMFKIICIESFDSVILLLAQVKNFTKQTFRKSSLQFFLSSAKITSIQAHQFLNLI